MFKYSELDSEDKEKILRSKVKGLESLHYEKRVALTVLESRDQTDAVRSSVETLRGEMTGIEETIATISSMTPEPQGLF